jgi:Ser/Thr protein kinase RdoA (MazF antagonist)
MDTFSLLPETVLAQYDLGEIHAVDPQPGGGIDRSFVVTAARGRYFFKQRSPAYTAEMVSCDHALIRFLTGHAFPTPAPVPARSGATWIECEGRLYEAYTYVKGATSFTPGDPRQMASLGRTVARYHRLVAGYRPPRPKLPPWRDLAGFLNLGPTIASQIATLLAHGRIGAPEVWSVREAVRQLGQQAEQVKRETDLVFLTVHGAMEPGNVLFDAASEVTAWVDWADSAHFVRAYDVAYALLKFAGRRLDAILPGQVGPALDWPGVERFALAYRQEIKLTAPECALLPWLMLACRVVDALWIDESLPIDHRRELGLAQELQAWLAQNTASLREVFS